MLEVVGGKVGPNFLIISSIVQADSTKRAKFSLVVTFDVPLSLLTAGQTLTSKKNVEEKLRHEGRIF